MSGSPKLDSDREDISENEMKSFQSILGIYLFLIDDEADRMMILSETANFSRFLVWWGWCGLLVLDEAIILTVEHELGEHDVHDGGGEQEHGH